MNREEKIISAAMGWVGTPYAHNCAIKGVGVDCGRILAEVYHEAGLIEYRPDFGQYDANWMKHRSDDLYLEWLRKYADEVELAKIGDVIVWLFVRTYSHGAILIGEEKIVHAVKQDGCVVIDNIARFGGRSVKYFRVRGIAWAQS